MSYILIIITGIIAIIGTTIKTTDDKGVKHFLKLTTGGVWLLIFLAASIVVSIINQINEDEKKADEKLAAQNKQTQDSLIRIKDSVTSSNRFLKDSLANTETITALKKQREFDSLQLLRDSSHFHTTLSKFGEQLESQNLAINEIIKVSNPLYPLKITYNFNIDLNRSFENFSSDIKNGFDSCINELRYEKHNPPNFFRYARKLDEGFPSFFYTSKISELSKNNYCHLAEVLSWNLPFQITMSIEDSKNTYLLTRNGSNAEIIFDYNNDSKKLQAILTEYIGDSGIIKNNLSSFNELNNKRLIINCNGVGDYCILKDITIEAGIYKKNNYSTANFKTHSSSTSLWKTFEAEINLTGKENTDSIVKNRISDGGRIFPFDIE